MAKFCTKCGKKLEEGQICDCQQNKEVTEVSNSTASNGFDFNDLINRYVDVVKGIFTKSASTIKKYATSNNFGLGMVALVLNIIVSGIFYYCFLSKNSDIYSLFNLAGGNLTSLLSGSVEVSFMETFLHGLLFMAVWFAVTALVIYIIAGPILKDKMDIKRSFALVGVCSIFTTLTTILAIICIYINTTLMLVVLLLAAIFYLTYLYQGLSDVTKIDKNKLVYVFIPAVALATFFMVYILPKILF